MSARFQELLKEQDEHLSAFTKAKNGLVKVKEKLSLEKDKAQAKIQVKREEQAKALAKLQVEIDAEVEAIKFADSQSKIVGKKIKSISKITG